MSETATNGAAAPVTINTQEVAQAALMFLGRADFKRHERQTFDMVEAFLGAIAGGQVIVTNKPADAAPDAPAAPKGKRGNGASSSEGLTTRMPPG